MATKDKAKAAAEARQYRAKRRAHPELFTCDCGRTGVEVRGNAVVCARCAAWEDTYYRRHAGYRGGCLGDDPTEERRSQVDYRIGSKVEVRSSVSPPSGGVK